MLNIPKAVIFDTDNTLYPYEPAHIKALEAVAEKLKKNYRIPKNKFNEHYKKAKIFVKSNLKNTASSHSRLLYFQNVIESLGMKTNILLCLDLEQTYWRVFFNNARLFDGVIDFIEFLKSKNIVIANITDLTTQIQFRKLVFFRLDEYFDYVVTSEEAGQDKPNYMPFKLAIDKLKIEPENIWMIGDNSVADMIGAENVGLKKIQKKHQGVNVIDHGKGKPDLVFNNYSDLLKYIKKIS